MAYSDTFGDNAQLLRKTVKGVADFSGRSRRTEVIYYWIAIVLVGVVLNFAVGAVVPFETSLLFSSALQLVLMIPIFALVVRRLHDQDRSGWWVIFLLLSVGLSIPSLIADLRGDAVAIISQKTTSVGIAVSLCALVVFVLCLWPGTDGANRYGPDPRLDGV